MTEDTPEKSSCAQVSLILGGARTRELGCTRMLKELVGRNSKAAVRSLSPTQLVLLSSGSASLSQVLSGTKPSRTRLDYRAVNQGFIPRCLRKREM